jgi:hypothetical protein
VDKVSPEHLQRNAMAMALMALILAERPLPEGSTPVIPGGPPADESKTTTATKE